MASNLIPDFLLEEEKTIDRKKKTAKEFTRAVNDFRASAKRLRETAADVIDYFAFSQAEVAKNWGMTSTERRIAFDATAQLVIDSEKKPTSTAAEEDASENPETESAIENNEAKEVDEAETGVEHPGDASGQTDTPDGQTSASWTNGSY